MAEQESPQNARMIEDSKLAELMAHATKDQEQSVVDNKREAIDLEMGKELTIDDILADPRHGTPGLRVHNTSEYRDQLIDDAVQNEEVDRRIANAKGDRVKEVYDRIKDL